MVSAIEDPPNDYLEDPIPAPTNTVDGGSAVPARPGLGVELDPDRVGRCHDQFCRLGGYPYDRDSARPDWLPAAPAQSYARFRD